MPYSEARFNLPEMTGLSAKQIEAHLKLYAGYVKNVNAVIAKIDEYKKDSEANAIALSELTRRYAFEWNGMRLHEIYFASLGGDGSMTGPLADAIAGYYGSIDSWKNEVKAMAMMRGIGWVLLVLDRTTNTLRNIWVSDHEVGHLAGCEVLFALDVWEHAYLLDYVPAQRADYVNAVFANLNWAAAEVRFMA
ncbi:MAG: Fe-Mn family superoxide dismutase [Patescibacteria group bacterium]